MHDIVIRGGTIIDGTGKAAFTGDVAIEGERIVEVGGRHGPARREIDATGLLVTPGWVDAHTHYDGQAMWDPLLAPSCWHGVTTAILGNCGVGFAPVRPQHRAALMELMEGVEEIPGIVLAEGLTWDWESFPDFLDALERRPRAIDIGAQLAHHPLRVYVMGDRAIRLEAANAEDIAQMRLLTIEACAPALSASPPRAPTPTRRPSARWCRRAIAATDELLGIGSALGAVGAGAFGMNSDFDDETAELAWMTQLAKETGRPVWFLLTDRYDDPAAVAAPAGGGACRAGAGRAFDGADRRPADRRHARHRHRAQSVLDTAELPRTRRPRHRRAARAAGRPGAAAQDPGREAVRAGGEPAGAVPPTDHHPLGQVLRHGRSAGL